MKAHEPLPKILEEDLPTAPPLLPPILTEPHAKIIENEDDNLDALDQEPEIPVTPATCILAELASGSSEAIAIGVGILPLPSQDQREQRKVDFDPMSPAFFGTSMTDQERIDRLTQIAETQHQ